MSEHGFSCLNCGKRACELMVDDHPHGCVEGGISAELHKQVHDRYLEPDIHRIYKASVRSSALCPNLTRVEETLEFALGLGARRIGLACCTMLLPEAHTFAKILEEAGFQAFGVACKVEGNRRRDLDVMLDDGMEGPALCNPIMQARLLEQQNTDLNVVVGLCVGHDTLFYQHSAAPVTTLATKDHITGHNACAALWARNTVYRKRINATVEKCRAAIEARKEPAGAGGASAGNACAAALVQADTAEAGEMR